MITDAMLREAAGEAERFLLAHLPEPQPHQFSPRFERRMQKLISRAKHPVRHQVLRYVAAVLLAILTLFGAVSAISPAVRAEIGSWFAEDSFLAQPSGDLALEEWKNYNLTWMPEGYTEQSTVPLGYGVVHSYTDNENRTLRFSYFYSGKLSSSVQGYEHKKVMLGEVQADLFLSPYVEKESKIIWKSPDGHVLFQITAYADDDQLVQMALSVEEKE